MWCYVWNLWNQTLSCAFTAILMFSWPHWPDNNCLNHLNVFTGCRGHLWLTGLKRAADKRHYSVMQSCHSSQFDVLSLSQLDLNHCNSSTLYQLTVKLISLDFGLSPQIRSDFCGTLMSQESYRKKGHKTENQMKTFLTCCDIKRNKYK